jgi:MFS family permease
MTDAADIAPVSRTGIALGLRENWQQFALLVLINAFVGGMVGLERTLVPLIGSETFQLASTAAITSFIVSFGVVKAMTNLVSGQLADSWGRKKTLVLGWAVGLPVPFLIMWAPAWGWIVTGRMWRAWDEFGKAKADRRALLCALGGGGATARKA